MRKKVRQDNKKKWDNDPKAGTQTKSKNERANLPGKGTGHQGRHLRIGSVLQPRTCGKAQEDAEEEAMHVRWRKGS